MDLSEKEFSDFIENHNKLTKSSKDIVNEIRIMYPNILQDIPMYLDTDFLFVYDSKKECKYWYCKLRLNKKLKVVNTDYDECSGYCNLVHDKCPFSYIQRVLNFQLKACVPIYVRLNTDFKIFW